LGFVLLGILNSARGLVEKKSEAICRRDRVVIVWFVVAWMLWFASWSAHRGEFMTSLPWSTMVLIPIVLLAAQGLEGILGRQFGLGAVLIAATVTLVTNAAPYISFRWHLSLASGLSLTSKATIGGLLCLLVICVVSVWVFQRLSVDDHRRRAAILLCILCGVVANAVMGLWSLKSQSDDERELIAFRRQLSVEPHPVECWLICDEVPPARLRFFLQSLRQRRTVRWVSDWDALFAESSTQDSVAMPKSANDSSRIKDSSRIVVTWGTQKWPAADLRQRGHTLLQATDPHFFQRRLLKAYRWSERSESK
jgi:hypothetical protein